MNIASEHLTRIQAYGYGRKEAEFLYLAATHSGYFTRRQFVHFANVENGGSGARFTRKALRLRHAQRTRYGQQTFVYNLHSQLIYEPIEKDSLHNNGRPSNDLIRARLMILDFVLDHLHPQYLETESRKVGFFHRELGLPLAILPGRSYKGIGTDCRTQRYFVDRSPIFVPSQPASQSLSLVPTFVYCDPGGPGLLRYIRHLRAYENLLNRLNAFNFVYAAPVDTKFKRAARIFAFRLGCGTELDPERLIRYFEIRQLWESHRTNSLTKADRQFLREGDKRFRTQPLENMYRRWATTRLSRSELQETFEQAKTSENRVFSTCILPNRHNIFERISTHVSTATASARPQVPAARLGSSPLVRLRSVTHRDGSDHE